MYLRLGWIVGQAGIIYTIGIILMAHVISVTTGLSLSSIATDKKVKAGGIYYILSRSLGLPFGGAIGATMYFAFSSEYLSLPYRFCRKFVAIDVVRNYLN
jgi:amino acid transporter